MMYLIISLFALAALAGVVILRSWLTKTTTSRTVVYLHGIVAALALVLLVLQALNNPSQQLYTSIILFVIAALGGFYMFILDLKGKYAPLGVAFVHALLAVGGFVVLLLFVFG